MTRIDEIRARADAATKGPWQWFGNTASDRVYLATTHSGRLYILAPSTRAEEYVFDHNASEGYPLDQARERVVEWCGNHDVPEEVLDECDGRALADHLEEFSGVLALLRWLDYVEESFANWEARSERPACICSELRDFLRGDLDPSEGRDFDARCDGLYAEVALMRGVSVHADLQFHDGSQLM